MAQKRIEYFFTPISPWTYLGHPRFYAIASCYDVVIDIKPCDLGRVFSVSGGIPVKQRAQQRQDYRLVELKRWRDYLGTPLNLQPKFFPVSADRACELIIAADLTGGTHAAMALALAIMRGCWAEDRNIDDDATLEELTQSLGLDPAALAAPDVRARAKARYEANTAEAVERGVFGAPWYVYQGEPYWGQDRLDLLERAVAR